MKLLIVESPSKAKTIEKYLGKEFTVKASVGHIRDLPKSNKKAIDIAGGFVPNYEISKGKEHIIEDIQHIAKKATEILLATDPDREGEAIAWHLAELLKEKGKKKIQRVTYHEITKEAVEEALLHPRPIDQNLRRAQEARRVLDRLVGYDLSGLIWKKVRYGLSAGRVQSPALRIIMEREREIRAFIPEDFFVLTGNFKSGKKEITLTCSIEPKTKKEADEIEDKAKAGTWSVTGIEKTEVKRAPRAPFITSTLQQVASTRLGFSPSRTMGVAQKLYEKGFITYMRTDSTTLGKQALSSIASVIEKQYGKEYLEFHTYAKKSKNAQEAHEAIRPTHAEVLSAGHTEDEKALYRLIWARTVSSQMKDARMLRTKIIGNIKDKSIPDFHANGSTVLFDGWLKGDGDAKGEENILPVFEENEHLDLIDFLTEAKQTTPPGRYTEAGLIKELEKRGIGRPSTYASIIHTLQDREYVTKENKSLKPTDTGDVVSTFLEENFADYISDDFTAEMEDKLDDIAEGKREYVKTLKDFYTPFAKEVKEKDKLAKATTFGVADEKFKCPKCGSGMLVKLSRGGKFLSCDKYPDCEGALTLEGLEIKSDEPIGNDPVTGLPIFVKNGRFGPYVQLGIQIKKSKTKPKKKKGVKNESEESTTVLLNPSNTESLDPSVPLLKPRMASIPKEYDPSNLSVKDALKFLSLPRILGLHPESQKEIMANKGRFGPYIVHDGDFRSLKKDDVFEITLARALEILAEPKKIGRKRFVKKAN